MKLVFYDDFVLGVLSGTKVFDVSEILAKVGPHRPQENINILIENFSTYRPLLEQASTQGLGLPLASVRLRPPVPEPSNIVCMAVNYMEDGTRTEAAPINAFLKPNSALIGPGDTMVLPDVPAAVFEGEAELAVVIGKRAKNVSADDAMSHVFGYMNFIDGSARGLPPKNNVFYQAKARDTFAPIGPYLVTADEVANPQDIAIELKINGVVKQRFSTSDMAHLIPQCIEWISSIHTLEPGDIIATGTNHRGLSALHDADVVELECAGLGSLKISVRDSLRRSWSRETRSERSAKGLDPLAPQLTGKYAPST